MFYPSKIPRILAIPVIVWGLGGLSERQVELDTDRTLTRIAFGSCADEELPQPIWDAVLGVDPDLFIFMGDNIYADVEDEKFVDLADDLAPMRKSYDLLGKVDGFQRLKRKVPLLATWDDHDYGKNNAAGDFAMKSEAKDIFLEFWEVKPEDPRRARDGIYHAETFGREGRRVQIILLDTRYFRSSLTLGDEHTAAGWPAIVPDPNPQKTMLGDAQWAWLEAQLKAPADLRIIVSSIQVIAEAFGLESWTKLPTERQRLFDLIESTKAEGVFFLSGDLHSGGLYRELEAPYPMFEITSSSLNRSFNVDLPGPRRLGTLFNKNNFGTLSIDWGTRTAALEIRTEDGTITKSLTVELEDLSPNQIAHR